METLRPIQRIAVIAICLALTAILAILLLPWISQQLESRLSTESTPALPSSIREPAPSPTPVSRANRQVSSVLRIL